MTDPLWCLAGQFIYGFFLWLQLVAQSYMTCDPRKQLCVCVCTDTRSDNSTAQSSPLKWRHNIAHYQVNNDTSLLWTANSLVVIPPIKTLRAPLWWSKRGCKWGSRDADRARRGAVSQRDINSTRRDQIQCCAFNLLPALSLAACSGAVTKACRTSDRGSLKIIPQIRLSPPCGDGKGEVRCCRLVVENWPFQLIVAQLVGRQQSLIDVWIGIWMREWPCQPLS